MSDMPKGGGDGRCVDVGGGGGGYSTGTDVGETTNANQVHCP